MLDLYLNVLASGVSAGIVFGLAAVGFGLYYQVTRIFHLAFGGLFTAGAYIAYQVAVAWGMGRAAGLVAGVLGAAVLGILIDSLVFQALERRKVDRHVILVAGLGADAIILAVCGLVWGATVRYYPTSGLEEVINLGPVTVTWLQLVIVGASCAFFALMQWILKATLVGRSIRAVAADPEVAVVTGINVEHVRRVTAGATAAAAGLAGILTTMSFGVHAGLSLLVLVMAATGALLGGQRGIAGAFVAGALLGVMQDAGSFVIGSEWKNSIAMVVLLSFLVIRTTLALRPPRRARVQAAVVP